MLRRPSSRLLVLDPDDRVLLFRFEHKKGALIGQTFWATPGGGLAEGEAFEQAAIRELFEETGVVVETAGRQVAQRLASFVLPTGEIVEADERYFVVRVHQSTVSTANWTKMEHTVISVHRWWSQAELEVTAEQVCPEHLCHMLIETGEWTSAPQ
ncbi:MAG: NUDIX domain-containing protein [Sphingomonas sp.]|nr:MAG: NUDIX domain-containing protein [Sphingomonas sp.]